MSIFHNHPVLQYLAKKTRVIPHTWYTILMGQHNVCTLYLFARMISSRFSCRPGACRPRQHKTHVTGYRASSPRYFQSIRCNASDEDPDWATEMSIFKKRTLKPNQLEALRKLEEESVSSGNVRCVLAFCRWMLLVSCHIRFFVGLVRSR